MISEEMIKERIKHLRELKKESKSKRLDNDIKLLLWVLTGEIK